MKKSKRRSKLKENSALQPIMEETIDQKDGGVKRKGHGEADVEVGMSIISPLADVKTPELPPHTPPDAQSEEEKEEGEDQERNWKRVKRSHEPEGEKERTKGEVKENKGKSTDVKTTEKNDKDHSIVSDQTKHESEKREGDRDRERPTERDKDRGRDRNKDRDRNRYRDKDSNKDKESYRLSEVMEMTWRLEGLLQRTARLAHDTRRAARLLGDHMNQVREYLKLEPAGPIDYFGGTEGVDTRVDDRNRGWNRDRDDRDRDRDRTRSGSRTVDDRISSSIFGPPSIELAGNNTELLQNQQGPHPADPGQPPTQQREQQEHPRQAQLRTPERDLHSRHPAVITSSDAHGPHSAASSSPPPSSFQRTADHPDRSPLAYYHRTIAGAPPPPSPSYQHDTDSNPNPRQTSRGSPLRSFSQDRLPHPNLWSSAYAPTSQADYKSRPLPATYSPDAMLTQYTTHSHYPLPPRPPSPAHDPAYYSRLNARYAEDARLDPTSRRGDRGDRSPYTSVRNRSPQHACEYASSEFADLSTLTHVLIHACIDKRARDAEEDEYVRRRAASAHNSPSPAPGASSPHPPPSSYPAAYMPPARHQQHHRDQTDWIDWRNRVAEYSSLGEGRHSLIEGRHEGRHHPHDIHLEHPREAAQHYSLHSRSSHPPSYPTRYSPPPSSPRTSHSQKHLDSLRHQRNESNDPPPSTSDTRTRTRIRPRTPPQASTEREGRHRR